MITQILKNIDSEECYYVGTNGCLYQDLDKQELLAIKEEIERLNNIIRRLEEDLREVYLTFGEFSEEYTENRIKELKGSDKE